MSKPDEVPFPDDPSTRPTAAQPPKSSSTALLIREDDRMRTGIEAAVLDVETGHLSLKTRGSFAIDEQVKIRLRNIVQRFEKEARGLVRKVDTNADGGTTVGIELLTRLSALEVSLVKMGIPRPDSASGSKWV